ncbi:MAG: YbjN domain-containing protein [Lepagella sp.]
MNKDLFKHVLEKWEFPIIDESEGRMMFRYQMSYVVINVNEGGVNNAVSVRLPNFLTADDDKEMSLALRTCNDLNYNLYQVKCYVEPSANITLSTEFFCSDDENLEEVLTMILQNIILAKKFFIRRYHELEEEAQLLSEIEQDSDED